MTLDPQTQQRLLELIYDLLPEAEAAELRSRIASDATLAEAYAQAQSTAALFAEAARLQAPKVPLTTLKAAAAAAGGAAAAPSASSPATAVGSVVPVSGAGAAGPRRQADPARRARAKWAHVIVALAASLLLAISLGGYWYHRGQLAEIAAEHLRIVVVGPAVVQAGAPAEFHVQTTSVTGDPMTAQVELSLYGSDGKRLWAHHQQSDDGRLSVGIPADVKLPPRARLEVLAVHRDKFERFDMPLAVLPAQYLTRISTDRSEYKAGEVVHCRAVTMSRWLQTPDWPAPIRFQLRDGSGRLVCHSALEAVATRGVAADDLRLAPSLRPGQYVLTACSAEGRIIPGSKPLRVVAGDAGGAQRDPQQLPPQGLQPHSPAQSVAAAPPAAHTQQTELPGPSERSGLSALSVPSGHSARSEASERSGHSGPSDRREPSDRSGTSETLLSKVEDGAAVTQIIVRFFPEGGALAAGVENRVYLSAGTPDGKPLRIAGEVVGPAGASLAEVRTGDHGLGAFSITPQLGQQYRLKIYKPQQVDTLIGLPTAAVEQKVALNVTQGVLEAGSPLEFTVRTARPGLPLVAAVYVGDMLIAQQPISADSQQAAVSAVLPLPAQASGVLRLILFDFSAAPPRPVAERLVYRRPSRWLDVQLAGLRKQYKPGETVEITLETTNEKGERAPAVLGISAVAERGPGSGPPPEAGASERHRWLAADLLLGAGLAEGGQLTDAERLLADLPSARETLELLLGTQPAVYLNTAGLTTELAKGTAGQNGQDRLSGRELLRLPQFAAGSSTECLPPALYDNLKRLHEQYDARLRQYQAHRTRLLNTLTTASFFGGLGLILLVAMLGVLRIVSGWHLWAPVVGVTACCLIIGAVLIDPSRLRPDGPGLVAFASYQPPAERKPGQENGRAEANADRLADVQRRQALQAGVRQQTSQQETTFGKGRDSPGDGMSLREGGGTGAAPPMPRSGEKQKTPEDQYKAKPAEKRQAAPGDDTAGKTEEAGKQARKLDAQPPAIVQKQGEAEHKDAAGQSNARKSPGEPKALMRRAAENMVAAGAAGEPAVAETVFWHPLVDTGAIGRTTIAFRLPDRPTTVRLRIDAHCQGRLGFAEAEIVVAAPSDTAAAREEKAGQ